jgi:hypothetical protein
MADVIPARMPHTGMTHTLDDVSTPSCSFEHPNDVIVDRRDWLDPSTGKNVAEQTSAGSARG